MANTIVNLGQSPVGSWHVGKRLCSQHVCVCIDMRIDMCMDMCTDMCIYMRAGMGRDMCIDMCTDMCADMRTWTCAYRRMHVDVCA